MFSCTDHSGYSSRFLYSECLDHLEDIHHSLCLTPLNVVAMAQNIPDLLTVSLHTTTHTHAQ